MATPGKPASLPRTPAELNQLLRDLFDAKTHPLTRPVTQWVTTSKAFAAFAHTYLRKIRKKIALCRDAEESYNLYCELRTAYLLLQEPRLAVAYEPYTKEQGRSPDFAVAFRTNTVFHVEVTRLRATPTAPQPDDVQLYESRRLVDVVCDKVQQLAPDTPNVLWIWSESAAIYTLDLPQVMLELKRRVEQRDPDLMARYGFAKPADFIRYYQRLSALVVLSPHTHVVPRPLLWWQNNGGKYPLPAKLTTLVTTLINADASPGFTAQT